MTCSNIIIKIISPAADAGEVKTYIISESSYSQQTYDVGTVVSKKFNGTPYRGKITEKAGKYYKVVYEDKDFEEMDDADVMKHRVRQWKLLCEHPEKSYTIMMDAPTWNEESQEYVFKQSYTSDDGKTFCVLEYMPVRIVFWNGIPKATLWFH